MEDGWYIDRKHSFVVFMSVSWLAMVGSLISTNIHMYLSTNVGRILGKFRSKFSVRF
jgi:hypothetical protein